MDELTGDEPLVSTDWLAANLLEVKTIDASWRMPGESSAREAYDKRHIPGAVFFDIDVIAEPDTDLPHMAPSSNAFAEALGDSGISEQDTVVVYDDAGIFSAPRVWWTFRLMGHKKVYVLDGGLKKWIAEGRIETSEPSDLQPTHYSATANSSLFAGHEKVRATLGAEAAQIIDARSAARFQGDAPEPRAGLRSGGMPGALNAPFDRFINGDGTLRPAAELREIFSAAGVDLRKPAITTCGSGITAAVLGLALERLGHRQWSLYDGSWAEWGKESNDSVAYPVIGKNS